MPRPKSTDTEATRLAIADVAEDLFRKVGYHKTTLADIASRLNMSPANIYRFFRSKLEINGIICDRLIADFEISWKGTIAETASATDNLTNFFIACHRHGRAYFLSNQGVYDMIDAAIEQNWPVMLKHMGNMTAFIAALVRAGVRRDEFQPCDAEHVASLFLLASHPFLDPRRVARTLQDCAALGVAEHMEQDLRGIIALLARGLSPQLPPLSW